MSTRSRNRALGTLLAGLMGWPVGMVLAWTPGIYPVSSGDLTVDAQDRNDVVSFWHGVYQASEGYQDRIGWSGNYSAASPYTNAEGTISAAFVADVERRLNFYRALCQVPTGVRFNTAATVLIDPNDPLNLYHPGSTPPLAADVTKAAAAQRSAYMLIRTYGYSLNGTPHPPLGDALAAMIHAPLAGHCVAWTTAAWNANHHGNLALGFFGPGAIDAYMAEGVSGVDAWNTDVGHRRWLLYPGATDFATGDTPGSFDPGTGMIRPPTNVVFVVPKTGECVTVPPRFVTYPAAGFFPAALNSRLWSLSYPGAGFDVATVTMTTAGGTPIPVTIRTRGETYGDPALVWQVPDAQAVTAVSADTTYHVMVGGITGAGVPASYNYTVTLINPNQLTADQSVFGPGSPQSSTTPIYQISPPGKAESLQVNCFRPLATAWSEGAEDTPTPTVIAHTASSYVFRSTANFSGFGPIAGAKSFRLTFPVWYDPRLNSVPEQWFEIDRDLLPGAGATFNFKYRRGYMTSYTKLLVETSNDGGVFWSQLGTAVTGNGTGVPDTAASNISLGMAESAVPVRVRFRLAVTPGMGFYADQYYNGFDYTTIPTGIFVDEIGTSNCQWLGLSKANDLSRTATAFVLDSASAGMAFSNNLEFRLRMRAKLGNHWMPYGPMKTVVLNAAAPTAAPVFNPPAMMPGSGRTITITGEIGATICYRIDGGAEVVAASPVTGITLPADGSTMTISAYAKRTGMSDSASVSASYAMSRFDLWMDTHFPGITDPDIVGPAADPDNDGQTNLLEFALGGNPADAGERGETHSLTAMDGATRVLTIAVRTGTPGFTGTPAPAATIDGVSYMIEGGTSPGAFTSPVVVADLVTTGLPPAPAGYEYRSFKLDAPAGPPPAGFLRVRITSMPE